MEDPQAHNVNPETPETSEIPGFEIINPGDPEHSHIANGVVEGTVEVPWDSKHGESINFLNDVYATYRTRFGCGHGEGCECNFEAIHSETAYI